MFQMAVKYPKCRPNILNVHRINQHFPISGPKKITQIGIFWYENAQSGNPEPRAMERRALLEKNKVARAKMF
jgi:hypothetical protein